MEERKEIKEKKKKKMKKERKEGRRKGKEKGGRKIWRGLGCDFVLGKRRKVFFYG